ncbi:MAG: DEAD/DEAH box helicase [Galactobacter sp.]|uniref:DEAD/DEAH box helicase n=1 Tax=Galactobacter sp. TaxID=2676125 RepID=UPI0025C6932D|nr:DEAD/DEAH box helicase [Galactobacter sp.]
MELLPSLQTGDLKRGLTDYLTTTFALTDRGVRESLDGFLADPDDGIFKGPYLRLRLPFKPAEPGWEDTLDWYEGFPPYGHQAKAFKRLASKPSDEQILAGQRFRRPQPTLVTTGTGSGKTESFLYPILDHVLRAKREGITGVKALILYPMNALANDQARRLAHLITKHDALRGVTAALYTGEAANEHRTAVTKDGLITDRGLIRETPPDILLTNYKMLDMLLLRPEDAPIWAKSADSLQYLVLDEFHTYDGAQGTDVALLIRRLGLMLARHRAHAENPGTPLADLALPAPADATNDASAEPAGGSAAEPDTAEPDTAEPGAVGPATAGGVLGQVTPVATSATLGTEGDPGAMLRFAETVFGETFSPDAVVTEDRFTAQEWSGLDAVPAFDQSQLDVDRVREFRDLAAELTEAGDLEGVMQAAYRLLRGDHKATPTLDPELTFNSGLELLRTSPLVHAILAHATDAISLEDLTERVLPGVRLNLLPGLRRTRQRSDEQVYALQREALQEFLALVIALISHVRAMDVKRGRESLSVETHLWVRELTRLDATVDEIPRFSWSDEGKPPLAGPDDVSLVLPSLYCRHCGRSGWGVLLASTGTDLAQDQSNVRRERLSRNERFRALMSGAPELDEATQPRGQRSDGLWFLDTVNRSLNHDLPKDDDESYRAGHVFPVLALMSHDDDPGKQALDDVCPACLAKDAIRFTGSSLATQLSVAVSGLFGSDALNTQEKKALVFTDSVQDAAHRAGFVQARSHTFTLRSTLRRALAETIAATGMDVHAGRASLESVVATAMSLAAPGGAGGAGSAEQRFALTPPDLTEHRNFRPYWDPKFAGKDESVKAAERVKQRLLFDAELEFGLNSATGRTLELTQAVAVQVEADSTTHLTRLARRALDALQDGAGNQISFLSDPTDAQLVAWARAILERIRTHGGIEHDWLKRYLETDGNRWQIWGGRRQWEGAPAFPKGRPAPSFPRIGHKPPNDAFDPVTSTQAWYARWTARVLGVAPSDSGALARALLDELAADGILKSFRTQSGVEFFQLSASRIVLSIPDGDALKAGEHAVECSRCKLVTPGTRQVVQQLTGAPCTTARCTGTLHPHQAEGDNFYRDLYSSHDTRRVVAREHTSLLPKNVRLDYETRFKNASHEPDAPNVLVATPTLEMGIDIGDLSTVMLASLPTSVANYVQRVGRAGRLTGNAMIVAFVPGTGKNLPRLHDPLSVINGSVRPPATYLGAREIVRRQFTASVLDLVAFDPTLAAPRTPRDVFGSVEHGTYLGAAMELAAAHAATLVANFARAVGHSGPSGVARAQGAREDLSAWLAPASGGGVSGFASYLTEAARHWDADVTELVDQRAAVQEAVNGDLQAALDEAKRLGDEGRRTEADRELRTAKATLASIRRSLSELTQTEYWVSVLERYGLLPNYTLLDDSVSLDVAVTWLDENTGQFETDPISLSRGASGALAELAPGATFYAQGMQIAVDAVDLGPAASAVERWQLCPECGWVNTAVALLRASVCALCGSGGIADVSQQLRVVPMTHVSAEVRRDEATINDRSEQRVRERFTIRAAASLDVTHRRSGWLASNVMDGGFGADYFDDAVIRWINFGRSGGGGAEHVVAGDTFKAPLFKVCEACGKLDIRVGKNEPFEHRAWCRYRKSRDEHNVEVALSRTLRTQAVVLHLPAAITYGDSFALPSLQAALLLGLREYIGGDPDHLDVLRVSDSGRGSSNQALLLHDRVPGGTGYLDDFSQPGVVRSVLAAALRVVSSCSCAGQDRLACQHCLLPFADSFELDNVSRLAAEQLLKQLLLSPSGGSDAADWEIEDAPERVRDTSIESHLEKQFRAALVKRLEDSGATVRETPGMLANSLRFKLQGKDEQWLLEPQVDVMGTRPDFILRQETGQATDIALAIYTDGFAYHASTAHNRVADDAAKRARLRSEGYLPNTGVERIIPWAITADDVTSFADNAPVAADLVRWKDARLVPGIQKRFAVDAEILGLTDRGAMDALWAWMHQPDVSAWTKVAQAVPYLWSRRNSGIESAVNAYLIAERLAQGEAAVGAGAAGVAGLGGSAGAGNVAEGGNPTWSWTSDHLAVTAQRVEFEGAPQIAVGLCLDERPSVLGTEAFKADWRTWLHLTNLLSFNDPDLLHVGTVSGRDPLSPPTVSGKTDPDRVAEVRNVSVAAPGETTAEAVGESSDTAAALSADWAELVAAAASEWESEFLTSLAHMGGLPLPVTGEEVDGVMVDIYWPEQHVAVISPEELENDPAVVQDVEQSGVRVIQGDAQAVAAAVTSTHTSENQEAGR